MEDDVMQTRPKSTVNSKDAPHRIEMPDYPNDKNIDLLQQAGARLYMAELAWMMPKRISRLES